MLHERVENGLLAPTAAPHIARPGILRQIGNGLGGLCVLLLTGLVLLIAVMVKSR